MKIKIIQILAVLMAMILVSCTEEVISSGQKENIVAVEGITLHTDSIDIIYRGKPEKLLVTIEPANASNREVFWSSTKSKRVAVSSDGLLSPERLGVSLVIATTEDGEYSDTCIVTVIEKTGGTDSLVTVPGGAFMMGSQIDSSEMPIHEVTVSSFKMSNTEVTFAEWARVMNDSSDISLLPKKSVTWFDAVLYCNARSKMEGKDTVYTYTGEPVYNSASQPNCIELVGVMANMSANGYRLPTEAEWEYAIRGGTKEEYWWMNSLSVTADSCAWYIANSYYSSHTVGVLHKNSFGLYDMGGNVREWCNDWYDTYSDAKQTNPSGNLSGVYRVIRGGSFLADITHCRSAFRLNVKPDVINYQYGFRVVCKP